MKLTIKYQNKDFNPTTPEDMYRIWKPLKDMVREEYSLAYMFMGSLTMSDGTILYQYKHDITREYIILDGLGNSFVADGERLDQFPTYRKQSVGELLNRMTADAVAKARQDIWIDLTYKNETDEPPAHS